MRKHFIRLFFGLFAVLLLALPMLAQNAAVRSALGDKYVISAKAGGTNLVEGNVTVLRADGTSGLLVKGDSVEVGDRVSTTGNGRAEIRLNPGSYLRVGANSSFEFKSTSLEDLTVFVHSGSVIFEVFATNDFTVNVELADSSFKLIQTGVYRINANEDADSIIVVRGRAVVSDRSGTTVKSGREATVDGDDVEIAKVNKRDSDDLDEWSKQRSKELVKMTASLRPRDFREPLLNSFYRNEWTMWDSFGLWVFNPYRGGWCFLPFGRGWRSPYGFWYGYDIWSYRLPWDIYYSYPRPRQQPTQPGQIPPKVDQGPSNTPRRSPTASAPPYVKVDSGSTPTSGRRTNPNFPPIDSPPILSPRPSSPPSVPIPRGGNDTKGKP